MNRGLREFLKKGDPLLTQTLLNLCMKMRVKRKSEGRRRARSEKE
jgi:hypothetical protein